MILFKKMIDKLNGPAQNTKLLKQSNQPVGELTRAAHHLTSTITESALTLTMLGAVL
jgi:hypothetical protein